MQRQFGLLAVSVMALICIPRIAPAGCPIMGARNTTCNSEASSIESCSNAVWYGLETVNLTEESLKKDPRNSSDRITSIEDAQAALPAAILLLGSATQYFPRNWSVSCGATWEGIDSCERALTNARRGLQLLLRPELTTALSPNTRERLRQSLLQHEADYMKQLDLIAASGQGDPSYLCNDAYASIATCKKAIVADEAAIRLKKFPVYRCEQIVPGEFVTEESAAAEAKREIGRPELRFFRPQPTLEQINWVFHDRVRRETDLLANLQHQ